MNPPANLDGPSSRERTLITKGEALLNRWTENHLIPSLLPKLSPIIALHRRQEAVRGAIDKERKRALGILAAVLPGEKKDEITKELIECGATVEEAKEVFKLRELSTITDEKTVKEQKV